MNHLISFVKNYPLAGLIIGIIFLILVGYINWHKSTNAKVERWIAKKIYRQELTSETPSTSLFRILTAFLLCSGLLMILFGLNFLG